MKKIRILVLVILFIPMLAVANEPINPIMLKIVEMAKARQIDPVLALAIVDIESKFNPRADRYEPKLKTYSVGLFQVLITTARLEFDFKGTKADLGKVDTNIHYGIEYLTRCISERGQKLPAIACCYNAGFYAKNSVCLKHEKVKQYLVQLKEKFYFWQQRYATTDM
jgi:Transglycosylase SLT domain